MNDYRCTRYCLHLCDINLKKNIFLKNFNQIHPNAKNHYSYIKERKGKLKGEFLSIYNNKCAYCGNSIKNLSIDLFEIDHFIPKERFTNSNDANNIFNLVASCHVCNRLKSNYDITESNKNLFDVETSLPKLFKRDENYYIKINNEYKSNADVVSFYEHLHLGYQTKRIDFVLMELNGMIDDHKYYKIRNQLIALYKEIVDKRNLISSFSQ